MTDFIHMKGGGRVKMNVGEPKISKIQGATVHDLLEVRLRKLSSDCSTIVLDYRE